MQPKLFALFTLLALAPACMAHTYFKAELLPFGNQEPDAPDSSALLDFLIHKGTAYWTLNVTDVRDFKGAQIVFGNPNVTTDEIVTLVDLGVANNVTDTFKGEFNATDFAPTYESWSAKTFAANAGLNHLWAIVISDAPYENVLLSGELQNYVPAGES